VRNTDHGDDDDNNNNNNNNNNTESTDVMVQTYFTGEIALHTAQTVNPKQLQQYTA
jgi:hypothetical protein